MQIDVDLWFLRLFIFERANRRFSNCGPGNYGHQGCQVGKGDVTIDAQIAELQLQKFLENLSKVKVILGKMSCKFFFSVMRH